MHVITIIQVQKNQTGVVCCYPQNLPFCLSFSCYWFLILLMFSFRKRWQLCVCSTLTDRAMFGLTYCTLWGWAGQPLPGSYLWSLWPCPVGLCNSLMEASIPLWDWSYPSSGRKQAGGTLGWCWWHCELQSKHHYCWTCGIFLCVFFLIGGHFITLKWKQINTIGKCEIHLL